MIDTVDLATSRFSHPYREDDADQRFPFYEEWQEALMGYLLTDGRLFRTYAVRIRREWWTSPRLSQIWDLTRKLSERTGGRAPTVTEVKESRDMVQLDLGDQNKLRSFIDRCIARRDVYGMDGVQLTLADWLRSLAAPHTQPLQVEMLGATEELLTKEEMRLVHGNRITLVTPGGQLDGICAVRANGTMVFRALGSKSPSYTLSIASTWISDAPYLIRDGVIVQWLPAAWTPSYSLYAARYVAQFIAPVDSAISYRTLTEDARRRLGFV